MYNVLGNNGISEVLDQKIVTGGDKLRHPLYKWLTIHPYEF